MKENKVLLICTLIFSLSVMFGSVWIGNSIKSANQSTLSLPSNKGLMTQKETAEYLSLSDAKFSALLSSDDSLRKNKSSFETYSFIPYIIVGGEKYFQREQVDKWVEFNSTRWSEK